MDSESWIYKVVIFFQLHWIVMKQKEITFCKKNQVSDVVKESSQAINSEDMNKNSGGTNSIGN